MDIRPKIRSTALVGALGLVAATAWATNESMSNAIFVPSYTATPSEPVVTTSDTFAVPVEERSVVRAPITVEERRLTEDERIQSAVMDRLASNSRLSGKIGVESRDAVVTLTGYTSTAGQAYRAGREAHGVLGVKYVQNEIRPRIGGSV
jgi:osmotically-inducible protein OsmY